VIFNVQVKGADGTVLFSKNIMAEGQEPNIQLAADTTPRRRWKRDWGRRSTLCSRIRCSWPAIFKAAGGKCARLRKDEPVSRIRRRLNLQTISFYDPAFPRRSLAAGGAGGVAALPGRHGKTDGGGAAQDAGSSNPSTIIEALDRLPVWYPASTNAVPIIKDLLRNHAVTRRAALALADYHAELALEEIRQVLGLLRSPDANEAMDGLKSPARPEGAGGPPRQGGRGDGAAA